MSDKPITRNDAPSRRSHSRWFFRVARVLLIGYVGLVGCAMIFEDRFIYFPSPYPEGDYHLAEARSPHLPRIEDVWLTTTDNTRIHGWYCQPPEGHRSENSDAQAVVLFFHGNAGNLSHRIDLIQMINDMNADVFIIDYHGYGRSEGKPSEAGFYQDADAAWAYLTTQRNIPSSRIIIFGKSIGAAPAINLARQVQPAGLIVESAFTSVPDMASQVLPIVPKFVVQTKMNSIDRIGEVTCPKLFTHSPVDEIIPYSHGQALFDAAKEPKTFYIVDGAGHNNMQYMGGKKYRDAVQAFIEQCVFEKQQESE